ncbi:hypothetical protein AN2V17_38090 [Vallitalea sp. AN17-2]|uniref:Uncharacterized protein n=2 Tax=Vallitalea maricola TaxID=3074433 RepID=A0ACB5UNL4_9FIRM|nr:hypothetical protein AN2V17_38090 [Vallitalea sp. AN17-2]
MIKPNKNQLIYQDLEQGIFFHFGIRTFNEAHVDWDGKNMDIHSFNPVDLDCEQWIRTVKEAGFRYAIMTTKHHDGFCLWPSAYTDNCVKNCQWRDGKGDVVKEFVDACKKYDIKAGLYYSPADFSIFDCNMSEQEYNQYIINQLSELMSHYGAIDLIWFDGCGSERCTYHWGDITKKVRSLQPNILIFSMGDPDFRWIGNESGVATKPCWNVVDRVHFSIQTEDMDDLGGKGSLWLPAECDCRIRKDNWFYSDEDEDTIKSLDELMGIYYYSVGRGTNLLMNIGPDRRGLVPEKDSKRLLEFGAEIKRRFSSPMASKKEFLVDGNKYVYKNEEGILMNHVIIKENLMNGEHVRKFVIKGTPYPYASEEILLYEGYNIGHKAICHFPSLSLKELTIEIIESSGEAVLDDICIYYCQSVE